MNRIASFNGEGLRMKWLSPLPEWIPDPVSVDIIHPKCGISSFADIVETDLAGCIRLSHIDCTLLKIERLPVEKNFLAALLLTSPGILDASCYDAIIQNGSGGDRYTYRCCQFISVGIGYIGTSLHSYGGVFRKIGRNLTNAGFFRKSISNMFAKTCFTTTFSL